MGDFPCSGNDGSWARVGLARILVPDLHNENCSWSQRDNAKNQNEVMLNLSLKAGPQTASGSPHPAEHLLLMVGFLVLAVVLGREIFEGSKAIAAGLHLLKLLPSGF